jgi:alkanesulfonate monooxygenase SsuD/methylene tetrahydromethanopterin reductase-like flavin-dependent oxidoreductase (luciferase family)
VAERIATLDLVSDGRVEFGTGESSSEMELGGFNIERGTKREQWEETIDAVTRMFVETPFAGYEGAYLRMPVRNVVPKPCQKPHPPLWVACSRRETIHLAASRGIGALSFSFIEPAAAREWVDDYYETICSDECLPAGFAVNPQVAVVTPFMCHPDEATAIDRGLDGGHFFGYSLGHYYVYGQHVPGRTDVWAEFQARRSDFGFDRRLAAREGQPLAARLMEERLGALRGSIGTPEQIREFLRGYEEAGVDQVIFVSQAGRNRHDHICESLELFAREVMPEFKERHEAREQEKMARLAPAIEAALARRQPPREVPPGYVVAAAAAV